MAESVVSFAVERIGDLLIQEGNFLAGVSGQVLRMQTELRRMLCFLEDADKRQDESKSVGNLVSDIRELAYDVENVIESFALQVASRREKGFRNKCKRYATIFIEGALVHKLGMEIQAIQARIVELTTSLTTYGIQLKNEPQGSTSLQQKLKRTYSHLVEEHTFGLDIDVKILVAKLRDEGRDNVGEIVSICGMGGLGKTTLANKLYHHVRVRDHFEAFAWHCVSQQFQARQVWEGILVKLVSPSKEKREEISRMKDDEIAKELYLLQQKRKCLVVLDDIWTTDAWDLLKPAFPIGKAVGGSKIVLTTRNKTLAIHGSPNAYIHELQFLNEHDSWELFQTKAFQKNINSDFKFNTDREKLGMEIVKKCAGLPLAIIVFGGLLATKQSFGEWEKVYKNVELYLMRGEGTDKKYSVVNGALTLSYNELPYQLKSCFLHLGHFPEDYDIPCNTLIRMWAAEGFVSQCQHDGEGNETMEDVAEHYLNDLIDRSIVQVSQTMLTGKVKACRLHDLMRDFCLSKATQEKYLKVVRDTNLNMKPNPDKVHRLVVHRGDGNDIDLGCYEKTPYLRSFLLVHLNKERWVFPRIKSLLSYFKFIKVLSLQRCRIGKMEGNEIGGLIHLRYLAFENCQILALPSSIGNLRYLQTLIVRANLLTCTIPNVLWKLDQLRHIILDFCEIKEFWGKKPLKLGKLRELQTLRCDNIYLSVSNIGELVNASQLENLGLRVNLSSSRHNQCISLDGIPSICLARLSSLYITSDDSDKQEEQEELKILFSSCHQLLKLSYRGEIQDNLPEWQHFPPNLTKLTLEFCELEEDPMPILEKLPNLRILRLHWRSFSGTLLVCSSKGFPKLQTLHLINLRNMEEWRVDEEAMPNLSDLNIDYCLRLKMIPEGIKFITTLRQLTIRRMPKEFEDRVLVVDGREGEDFYKVRHVPEIIIRYTY